PRPAPPPVPRGGDPPPPRRADPDPPRHDQQVVTGRSGHVPPSAVGPADPDHPPGRASAQRAGHRAHRPHRLRQSKVGARAADGNRDLADSWRVQHGELPRLVRGNRLVDRPQAERHRVVRLLLALHDLVASWQYRGGHLAHGSPRAVLDAAYRSSILIGVACSRDDAADMTRCNNWYPRPASDSQAARTASALNSNVMVSATAVALNCHWYGGTSQDRPRRTPWPSVLTMSWRAPGAGPARGARAPPVNPNPH